MKAVAYQKPLPIADAQSLVDVDLPEPVPQSSAGKWGILGWDAGGTVRAVGRNVSSLQPGDRVWYAGAIDRPGTNAEARLVDERIAAISPSVAGYG